LSSERTGGGGKGREKEEGRRGSEGRGTGRRGRWLV